MTSATAKLYWQDAYLVNFEAIVQDVQTAQAQTIVVLDQTAFYPESGGQLSDRGTLNGLPLAKVEQAKAGQILHYIDQPVTFGLGDRITGAIDLNWRREMMQQHTGQHVLSQAFFQLYGAETNGFRILGEVTQIDLSFDFALAEPSVALAQAEVLANQIVFENRQVRVSEVTPEQAAQMPLRKESFIADCIRVVEIDQFDWSPCGGTHVRQTGEIGLIAVRGWERAKQMLRVDFVCGLRALRDYRATNEITSTLARNFTVGRNEVLGSVARLTEEHKTLQKRAKALGEKAAQAVAADLFAQAKTTSGDLTVIAELLVETSFEEAKLIAHRLVANAQTIALLAVPEGEGVKLVFARSADSAADMNALLKQACERLNGRGGGKPDFAQGGAANLSETADMLAQIAESLQARSVVN